MKIINTKNNAVLAETTEFADTPFTRLKGLLGRASLPKGCALIIRPCNSVHTFFMRFAIDILFVDASQRVIKASQSIPPFRLSAVCFKAVCVIELPSGTIAATSTSSGDTLSFQ